MRGVVVQATFKGSGVERYVYAPIVDADEEATSSPLGAPDTTIAPIGPGIHPSAAAAPTIDPVTGLPVHTPTVEPAAAYPADLASTLEPDNDADGQENVEPDEGPLTPSPARCARSFGSAAALPSASSPICPANTSVSGASRCPPGRPR